MKALKWIAVMMALTMIFALPIIAEDESVTDAVSDETAVADTKEPADSQTMLAIILLSTVAAAMVISTLTHKGVDHTKYL